MYINKKEFDRQSDELALKNSMLITMFIVIVGLLFLTFGYIEKASELNETNKQLETKIEQLQDDNNALQDEYIQSQRLLNDARLKLLTGYKNAVTEVVKEIRSTYYIEGIKLTQEEQQYIHKISDMYELGYTMVIGLVDLESSFEANAIGINRDKYGNITSKDYSYMQFNGGNEKWVEGKLGRDLNLMEFKDNIDGGMWLLNYYMEDNTHKGLTQYNKGKQGAINYYDSHGTFKSEYAKQVLKRMGKYE